MTATRFAFGWGVEQVTVAPRNGKMIGVGYGYWNVDHTAGQPGFNGKPSAGADTTFQADSRRTLQAMILWLTGKATGANILVVQNGDGNTHTVTPGLAWGNEFCDALVAAGHTVTYTNGPNWTGFEPLDYDLMCVSEGYTVFTYHGSNDPAVQVDYILTHRGRLLVDIQTHNGWPSAYGIGGGGTGGGFHGQNITAGHSVHNGFIANRGPDMSDSVAPGNWREQRPFDCAAFGDPGSGGSWSTNYYALVMGTTLGLYATSPPTNTKGGTSTIISCACETVGDHGVTKDTKGVIGLWWL